MSRRTVWYAPDGAEILAPDSRGVPMVVYRGHVIPMQFFGWVEEEDIVVLPEESEEP